MTSFFMPRIMYNVQKNKGKEVKVVNQLTRKEVIIKSSSQLSIDEAKQWTINWLNQHQESPQNKMGACQGGMFYQTFFFAELFDSRSGCIYKIFSNACVTHFGLQKQVMDVLILPNFIKWDSVSDNPNLEERPSALITRGGVFNVVNNMSEDIRDSIRSSELKNDMLTVSNNRITLTEEPIGDIIGGMCKIFVSNGVYDEVECQVSGKEVTIQANTPNEYNGKTALVTYLKKG